MLITLIDHRREIVAASLRTGNYGDRVRIKVTIDIAARFAVGITTV